MNLEKYSIGTGDRFGLQGKAQLAAIQKAHEKGVDITIVWNKSHREHTIVGTSQQAVRKEADLAVTTNNWHGQYLVDADHIGLSNVDLFLDSSDFFTLDVADFIGKEADEKKISDFILKNEKYTGELIVPGIDKPLKISRELIENVAKKYLFAIEEAGEIYRYIAKVKGSSSFITEVSMDETADPQTPVELFFILSAIADENIPAQTIAPKFSGRFNKGVDYIGDLSQFTQEFEEDLSVINHAINLFSLPENLKLSVHSGSDKFSLYPVIKDAIKKFDAGIHIKTAGTTWLEELIGLAEAEGEGLDIAKQIYLQAHDRFDELCSPYASVIDIDPDKLPTPDEVLNWTAKQYINALRHDQSCPEYNNHLRQLLHVGYKVAAELGDTYLNALRSNEEVVAKNVTENLFTRHIKPLFL